MLLRGWLLLYGGGTTSVRGQRGTAGPAHRNTVNRCPYGGAGPEKPCPDGWERPIDRSDPAALGYTPNGVYPSAAKLGTSRESIIPTESPPNPCNKTFQ